ncbi:UNVERIFIED_CONTAM: chitin deacetylase, partial [Siphonaria sp. JEL0065]
SVTPGVLDSMCTSVTPVWGLTYDDGPSAYTDDLLAHLAAKNIKATFFVVGTYVLNNPDVLLRTYQAGHQIGIHTWSHADMATLTVDQQIAEIVNTAKIIKQVIGVVPTVWRPPFYSTNTNVMKIAAALGLRTIVWSLDSRDWAIQSGGQTAAGVTQMFQDAVNSGSQSPISLEHDGFSYSEAAAPAVLDVLTNGKINIGTIKDCLGLPQAYGGVLDLYLASPASTVTATVSQTTTTTTIAPPQSSTTVAQSSSTTTTTTVSVQTATASGTTCYPAWSSSTPSYNGGAQISYKDVNYVANWWSGPSDVPGVSGSWKAVGACGSGSTTTTTTVPITSSTTTTTIPVKSSTTTTTTVPITSSTTTTTVQVKSSTTTTTTIPIKSSSTTTTTTKVATTTAGSGGPVVGGSCSTGTSQCSAGTMFYCQGVKWIVWYNGC